MVIIQRNILHNISKRNKTPTDNNNRDKIKLQLGNQISKDLGHILSLLGLHKILNFRRLAIIKH